MGKMKAKIGAATPKVLWLDATPNDQDLETLTPGEFFRSHIRKELFMRMERTTAPITNRYIWVWSFSENRMLQWPPTSKVIPIEDVLIKVKP
jgi:hypothetical protein